MIQDDKYSIRVLDLEIGNHQLNFKIDDEFFQSFEDSEIKKANVLIELGLEKSERSIRIQVKLSGEVSTLCDRCSDEFNCSVNLEEVLIAEFGNSNSDLSDADQKVMIERSAILLDLKKHFFDYIYMSLPIRRVHPENQEGESTCNASMIERLENINNKDANLNEDPRWAELKKLLN